MPIYEYQCEKCGNVFEEWQSGFEEREMPCPQCEGCSKRMISNTSFVLKGSGWYVTDYAGKTPASGNEAAAGDGGNGNGSETKGDSGAAASEATSSESASGSDSTSAGSAS